MKSDNKNLILAVTLSMLILVLYQLYFTPPPTHGRTDCRAKYGAKYRAECGSNAGR